MNKKTRQYLKNENEFPTITKDNLVTWNEIVYGFIIQGMLHERPDLQYGRAMTLADNLTNKLFHAMKVESNIQEQIKKLEVQLPKIQKKTEEFRNRYNSIKNQRLQMCLDYGLASSLGKLNCHKRIIKELKQLEKVK